MDEKGEASGRGLNIAGVILAIIVFVSIFLAFPFTNEQRILISWIIASFYFPLLLGILGHAQGDKKLGSMVIILGIIIIILFIASLLAVNLFIPLA